MNTQPHRHASGVRKRISAAYRALRKAGYVCKHSWKCCLGCGNAAMPEGTTKAVFYHRQDAANLRKTGHVYLAWTGRGTVVADAMRDAGLTVQWDNSIQTRIRVSL